MSSEKDIDLKTLEGQLQETQVELQEFIEKGRGEIEEAGEASRETKASVEKLIEKMQGMEDRFAELEQRTANYIEVAEDEQKSIGELIVESDEFKRIQKDGSGVANLHVKTAIVNDNPPTMTQPMVAGHRLDRVVKEPDRALRIRDLLPSGTTTSNIVWFPKENTFTNAADVVRNTAVSPIVAAENVTKPESALTFTSDSEAVVTIAHFVPVSKQAMDDSAFLSGYLNQRLGYGYRLKEETELLAGTGVTGYVTGINTDATTYAQADSPNAYSTNIDFVRDAARQAEVANYEPSVAILNPKDWSDIELSKDTTGQYIFANPQALAGPSLWGLRVLKSNSQTAGTFTVLDPNVCQIFDREGMNIQISFENQDNFEKNMVTVRAEGRLAFCIYNAAGIISGSFV
jgi:HK97 family phage major capsid protein